ncbi:hypothetical protein BSKO_06358 [Bryopsis sp. KO-2023]|nr:hypothetical protein BSKO_06358 [Bryopsis sp. KO-2023]
MHPLQSTPPVALWNTPILRKNTNVDLDDQGLQALALQGCWQTIIREVSVKSVAPVEDKLERATYLVLALMKTKQYTRAAEELQQLGDFDSSEFSKQTPKGCVNVVPFALRLLHAQLPQFLGKPKVAIDLLYRLLDFCLNKQSSVAGDPEEETELDQPSTTGGESATGEETQVGKIDSKASWSRRHETVVWCLISHHLLFGDFIVALRWLNWLLENRRQDCKVWFAVACVQLMLGDVLEAKVSSQKVSDSSLSILLQGLCDFSLGEHRSAAGVFDSVTANVSVRSAVLNNKSICHVHLSNLPAATNTLMVGLHERPLQTVHEHLVLTLCTLYDLKGGIAGREARNQLANYLNNFIPDDFDKSVFLQT